jgi:transposase
MHGMRRRIGSHAEAQAIIAAALQGQLTEGQAERLAVLGPEAVKLALLATAKRIAEQCLTIAELQTKLKVANQISPSTPSGQIPIYAKPQSPRRKGKPGAKPGHKGTHRRKPDRIDRREEHRLPRCPDCGGPLQRCNRTRVRTIEDIPKEVQTEVVEHTIHRDYCPRCKKHVEPVVADALPNASIGHRLVAMTAWLHYGLGVTLVQILDILGHHLRVFLTPGGLVAAWQRLAEVLESWYEQISKEALRSAVLHADETGWRVNGQTCWLWCFCSKSSCYYIIDRSRGSPALQKFFLETFDGVLVHDFWAAYEAVCAEDHQCCLVHLLRELEKVDEHNGSAEWAAFAKQLRRLLRDGMRLRRRQDFSPQRYASRIARIDGRLIALAEAQYTDADARRLAKRLDKYRDSLFTFLDRPEVPFENNMAERQIRPAVILRKNGQSNRSEKGAAVQAVLMSVYRTLKLRGHDPMDAIATALRTYLTTGQLPPFPAPSLQTAE